MVPDSPVVSVNLQTRYQRRMVAEVTPNLSANCPTDRREKSISFIEKGGHHPNLYKIDQQFGD